MATANFNIPLVFTAPTQVEADNKREAALLDYCKAYGLDIYTDETRTVIDPAKVPVAFRQHMRGHIRAVVIAQRAGLAGRTAEQIERQNQEGSLDIT